MTPVAAALGIVVVAISAQIKVITYQTLVTFTNKAAFATRVTANTYGT